MRGEHAQGLGLGRDGGEKTGVTTGRTVEEKKREMVAGVKLSERMGDGRMRKRVKGEDGKRENLNGTRRGRRKY